MPKKEFEKRSGEVDLKTVLHPAVLEALKQGDARAVVVGLATEAAEVARAVIASERFTPADVASIWGESLTMALTPPNAQAINWPTHTA